MNAPLGNSAEKFNIELPQSITDNSLTPSARIFSIHSAEGVIFFSKLRQTILPRACMKEKCERMYAYEATNCFTGTGGAA